LEKKTLLSELREGGKRDPSFEEKRRGRSDLLKDFREKKGKEQKTAVPISKAKWGGTLRQRMQSPLHRIREGKRVVRKGPSLSHPGYPFPGGMKRAGGVPLLVLRRGGEGRSAFISITHVLGGGKENNSVSQESSVAVCGGKRNCLSSAEEGAFFKLLRGGRKLFHQRGGEQITYPPLGTHWEGEGGGAVFFSGSLSFRAIGGSPPALLECCLLTGRGKNV